MKTKRDAKKLGKAMTKIGEYFGKKVKINLGRMDIPLGNHIGAKLEALEALQVLRGKKNMLYFECVKISALLVHLDKNISFKSAKKQVLNVLESGAALEKLKTMIKDQGGSLELFDYELEKPTFVVKATTSGKVTKIATKSLGEIVSSFKNDNYGIITKFTLGTKVQQNDVLFEVYLDKNSKKIAQMLIDCVVIK